MKQFLTVVGVAGVVVAAWWVLGADPGRAPGALGAVGDRSRGADLSPVPDGQIDPIATSGGGAGDVIYLGPPGEPVDLPSRCARQGVVGASVLRMVEGAAGHDVALLDRAALVSEIAAILDAWARQPDRRDEDIDFLVRAWADITDPSARYALSWLFRRVGDDRMIAPLLELLPIHPWAAVDAIADQGTPRASQTLIETRRQIADPATRAQATVRFARLGGPDALAALQDILEGDGESDEDRMVAVECLAHLDDPEARLRALQIAQGPSQPLSGLSELRWKSYGSPDLRSGAVLALMHAGEQGLVRTLLDRADHPSADPQLQRFVDFHLGSYQGPDITEILGERATRRQKVSVGEARYFNRMCHQEELPLLRRLVPWADSAETRQLLEAAILTAQTRRRHPVTLEEPGGR